MGNSFVPPATPKVIGTNNSKEDHEEVISITEKINLTKKQYQVLNIICNTYEESISQYLEEALVEAMRFDIEEGNFCDALLEKIGEDNSKKIPLLHPLPLLLPTSDISSRASFMKHNF